MLSTKFCLLQVLFVLHLNNVNGGCPYAHQFNDDYISNDVQLSAVTKSLSYLSAISYDTYPNVCHQYAPQPPKVTSEIIDHALATAVNQTKRYIALDSEAARGATAPDSLMAMDRINYFLESATRYIQENTCSSKSTTTLLLQTLALDNVTNFVDQSITPVPYACVDGHVPYPDCSDKSALRQVNGTCNNLERPFDGSVGDCMLRLLPPDYKDGISYLRTSIDGTPLPNAKVLSMHLFGGPEDRPLSSHLSLFQSLFGEFVIGDSGETLNHNTGLFQLQCCDIDGQPRVDHPQCAPFFTPPVKNSEEAYPNGRCMEFVRSLACTRCKLGPRMITNGVTAAQDLNSVYGVSDEMLRNRRKLKGGYLKSQEVNGEELFATEKIDGGKRYRCFKRRCEISPLDIRNLLTPTGVVFALLFHRNHNRHARNIAALNPKWKDEEVFQAARRWNIAEYQHILYNEYLETLIGENLMNHFSLHPQPSSEFSYYEDDISPKTIVEFQSTAARQGHTTVLENITIIEPTTLREYSISQRDSDVFQKIFEGGLVDGVLLAEMYNPAFESTPSIPFKNFVEDRPNLDLAALDIHRQRDHGITGYIYYLKYLHGVGVKQWKDLHKFIDWENIKKLKAHYTNVEDVELYVGGHHERKIDGAIVGQTFAHIIGLQFHNVKFGDRFFYEHANQVGSFSVAQLNEIKTKSCFAHVLCKNTKLDHVLLDPFRVPSSDNKFVHCSEFTEIDYKF